MLSMTKDICGIEITEGVALGYYVLALWAAALLRRGACE